MCDSKELLVSFLYDELDLPARRTFEAHLASCPECRAEVAELRDTRALVASWTPPEPDFGFRIVGRGTAAAAPAPPPRYRLAPAWGLAAAAVLVLAAGAAIANLEVRYDAGGLSVRTGWQHAPAALTAGGGAAAVPGVAVDWKAQAEALDRRVHDLEQVVAMRPQAAHVQDASASDLSDAAVLQRVRELIGQSEARQQRVLAGRLTELSTGFERQRRVDLAAIDQGMARLQNANGAEVKQYRDAIQRIYRATYQQK